MTVMWQANHDRLLQLIWLLSVLVSALSVSISFLVDGTLSLSATWWALFSVTGFCWVTRLVRS